jgi:tight adherence protein C
MSTLLLLFATFFGLSVILIFIGLAIPSGPSREQERLQTYGTRPRTLTELEMSQPFSDRVVVPLLRNTSGFFARFTPKQNVEEMKHKIELAGNPNNWTAADFLGVRGLSVIITAILVLVPMLVLRVPILQTILFTAIAAFLGFYLPMFWLNSKIRTRQHDIQKALPDALDLLTICTEAGQGFDAAMAKVTEKWDNELSRAFARANAEVRLGKLRREALRDMANRADVPNLTNFIAAVIQADQLGVSMAKVLRIQSEQMRVKRRQRAEELAAQAPVKMMFPLVFLIFPSIMIVLLGPAVLIFTSGGGFTGKK